MKKIFCCLLLVCSVSAFALSQTFPANTQESRVGCGGVARAEVEFKHKSYLTMWGTQYVPDRTFRLVNDNLHDNPPHNGTGNGSAYVKVVVTVEFEEIDGEVYSTFHTDGSDFDTQYCDEHQSEGCMD